MVRSQTSARTSSVSGLSPSGSGSRTGPGEAPSGAASSRASRTTLWPSIARTRQVVPRARIRVPTENSARADRYSTSPSGKRKRRIGVAMKTLYSSAAYDEASPVAEDVFERCCCRVAFARYSLSAGSTWIVCTASSSIRVTDHSDPRRRSVSPTDGVPRRARSYSKSPSGNRITNAREGIPDLRESPELACPGQWGRKPPGVTKKPEGSESRAFRRSVAVGAARRLRRCCER